MSENVPAAHSMDSEWWAVDENGEVARFSTGEDGALPSAAGVVLGNADDGGAHAFFHAKYEEAWDEEADEALDIGVTTYANDDYGNPGAYVRRKRPSKPLMLAELPAEARAQVSKLKLPISFASADKVHLADLGNLGEMSMWSDPGAVTFGDDDYEAALRGELDPDADIERVRAEGRAKEAARDLANASEKADPAALAEEALAYDEALEREIERSFAASTIPPGPPPKESTRPPMPSQPPRRSDSSHPRGPSQKKVVRWVMLLVAIALVVWLAERIIP